MSFTYSLSTSIGRVRLNINDRTEPATFSDEELQAFLDQVGGDVNMATALAFFTLAGQSTGSSKRISAGEYSEDLSDGAKQYLELAKAFAAQAADVPAEAIAENPATEPGFRQFLVNEILRGHE